jgi:hypothetical protein
MSNEVRLRIEHRVGSAMDRTHLGSVDEDLDELLDTRRRLQDGIPLEEFFNKARVSRVLSRFPQMMKGRGGANSPEPVFTACT